MERVTFAADGALEGNTLSGIAYAFGEQTLRGDQWWTFDRHAFDKALRKSDVRAFVNHNQDLLLGRQKSGTVKVKATDQGLQYAIDLPDTSYAQDLKALVARGDLTEMSFGVELGDFLISKGPGGRQLYTHTNVASIFDISPVAMPAFEGTSVALHSATGSESRAGQLIRARHRAIYGGSTR